MGVEWRSALSRLVPPSPRTHLASHCYTTNYIYQHALSLRSGASHLHTSSSRVCPRHAAKRLSSCPHIAAPNSSHSPSSIRHLKHFSASLRICLIYRQIRECANRSAPSFPGLLLMRTAIGDMLQRVHQWSSESASNTCSRGPSDDADTSWMIGCSASQGQRAYMLVRHSLVSYTLR
jgi:hypothetical protein